MTSPPGSADVTVIVVTYNSAHCIDGLAPTLAALPHVTIVDNASNDGTVEAVARAMPNALILRNQENRGFGAANNLALRQVKTPYALLLNPDCLPTPDLLARLLEVARAYPDAAMIAPHLIRRNGEVEVSYRWPGTHWRSRGPAAEGICCVGFVCGAVMLINIAAMQEIGFFDEDFFLYYEDEDLCQRIFTRRKAIIVAPHVTVTHLSRGSVRGNSPLRAEFYRGYHHAQSKLIFTEKHLGAAHAARLRRKTLALAVAALLPRLLVPAPRYVARLLGRIRGLCAATIPYSAQANHTQTT
ncbi:glycosyltransferase family 2 protein [Noviherbaspirillum sedimenti]|uniref:Glycosyltransferase family 2 protein n=1 Tax=Noviherbaspirillum sedimenti TaxID=2320865 RepID=A0A3A3G0P7_9BURK|nr:glycosyltransferase family 2 protein [Noviherbaspirillum sedimenti]RJG02017.1 glycosyltransferase family 2 protein [Noviherbaspirillum sedimenti]